MLILDAIKHTPIGLKVANVSSWAIIALSEKIDKVINFLDYNETIDFLDPQVAQSISYYSATILSIITAIIAIRKEMERRKNAKLDK